MLAKRRTISNKETMIIEKVQFKYSKGDKVRYTKDKYKYLYWTKKSDVPVTEREYTIDGYGFDITSEGIRKWYLFHAYCDEYFEYHEKVNEELLEPISEPTPNIITDIHFKDVFDEDLEIGDNVYHDVYTLTNRKVGIYSLGFFRMGNIKGFRYSHNDHFSYEKNVMMQDCQSPNSGEKYITNRNDICTSVCKTLPDKKTIIRDIIKNPYVGLYHYKGNFDSLYKSEVNGLEFLGISEELFNETWEEIKKEKEEGKKTTKKKKTTTTSSTKKKKKKNDEDIINKIKEMSDEEKKELLKLLQS